MRKHCTIFFLNGKLKGDISLPSRAEILLIFSLPNSLQRKFPQYSVINYHRSSYRKQPIRLRLILINENNCGGVQLFDFCAHDGVGLAILQDVHLTVAEEFWGIGC